MSNEEYERLRGSIGVLKREWVVLWMNGCFMLCVSFER